MVEFLQSCAVGVGHRPRPGSIVLSAEGRRVNMVSLALITLGSKVTFNALKGSCIDVSRNILSKHENGSVSSDLVKGERPKRSPVSPGISSTVPLTGVSAGDRIYFTLIINAGNILKDWDIGKILTQIRPAPSITLGKSDRFEATRALKTDREDVASSWRYAPVYDEPLFVQPGLRVCPPGRVSHQSPIFRIVSVAFVALHDGIHAGRMVLASTQANDLRMAQSSGAIHPSHDEMAGMCVLASF